MTDALLSVGIDVGTTTTQLIVSRLLLENRATGFAVPEMEITRREILYRSPVYFTPLTAGDLADGGKLRQIVENEYAAAGITPGAVDTGAVIITGETSRKENARTALESLSGFAGDFVAATAGPDLESVLAAKGAGAVEYSRETGKTVLHMDIGGGTSNLALIREGNIVATGCVNAGGRLIKLEQGRVSYVSPVLQGLTDLKTGDYPAPGQIEGIAKILVTALEMAAGLRPATELLDKLWTKECGNAWSSPRAECTLSFSGGVADCIETARRPGTFGDMGVELGQAIKESLLCRGEYRVAENAIRATVIGAGCHSARLSGSTVFCRDVALPLKNLPVAVFDRQEQDSSDLPRLIQTKLLQLDTDRAVLAFPGVTGGYDRLCALAEKIAAANCPVLVCLEQDMAKALGQRLALTLPEQPILCIDRIRLSPDSYLDIGAPTGPAIPVVVKTLVMNT